MSEETSQNRKKQKTRSPDGMIQEGAETRTKTKWGKTVEYEHKYFEARKRYRCGVCEKCKANPRYHHEKKRRTDTYSEAVKALNDLRTEIADELHKKKTEQIKDNPQNATFFRLLDFYQTEYVRPAEYSGNQKTGGFRENVNEMKRAIRIFREHFGDVPLSEITYQKLREFKMKRLNTPVVVKKTKKTEDGVAPTNGLTKFRTETLIETRPRKIATVHRELARLNRIFNVAVQNSMIAVNPFSRGDSLISQALETERTRILSPDEEKRLLAVCVGERNHLYPIIVCALDTAMRRGEILGLKWNQINVEKRIIKLPSLSTKTLKPRIVPISSRLADELKKLQIGAGGNGFVFPFADIKRSFQKARELARLQDLRFHDLRGTAITRMLEAGLSASQVMKISGHTVYKTFSRYIKSDEEMIQSAGNLLDNWLETKSKGTSYGTHEKAAFDEAA